MLILFGAMPPFTYISPVPEKSKCSMVSRYTDGTKSELLVLNVAPAIGNR